jgi:hypothetical protein
MQRGALGARSLNADLQKALNPNPSARIEKFGSLFAPGDKIMQTENDYARDVFNGDLQTDDSKMAPRDRVAVRAPHPDIWRLWLSPMRSPGR